MRIVYFAASERDGPSSRYRIYQYREALRQGGVDLVIAPALSNRYFAAERGRGLLRFLRRAATLATGLARRLAQLRYLRKADGVVIEREFFPWLPPLFEWLLSRRRNGYVLELDDAIYLSRGRRWKYPGLLRRARAVIAGNEHLASYARGLNPLVFVVPTTVSIAACPVKASYTLGTPARIGWVGLASNFPHLAAAGAALHEVCAQLPARLVVVSARPPVLDLPIEFVPWDERTETATIRTFDIGIMPLFDTAFARGKCGLKLLQYMSCGVPCIASPVGVNRDIIHSGDNGLLAADPAAWHDCLLQLLTDEALRQRLGAAGRRTVELHYALETWGPRLAALYSTLFRAS